MPFETRVRISLAYPFCWLPSNCICHAWWQCWIEILPMSHVVVMHSGSEALWLCYRKWWVTVKIEIVRLNCSGIQESLRACASETKFGGQGLPRLVASRPPLEAWGGGKKRKKNNLELAGQFFFVILFFAPPPLPRLPPRLHFSEPKHRNTENNETLLLICLAHIT